MSNLKANIVANWVARAREEMVNTQVWLASEIAMRTCLSAISTGDVPVMLSRRGS
jgi:hypothetical protein